MKTTILRRKFRKINEQNFREEKWRNKIARKLENKNTCRKCLSRKEGRLSPDDQEENQWIDRRQSKFRHQQRDVGSHRSRNFTSQLRSTGRDEKSPDSRLPNVCRNHSSLSWKSCRFTTVGILSQHHQFFDNRKCLQPATLAVSMLYTFCQLNSCDLTQHNSLISNFYWPLSFGQQVDHSVQKQRAFWQLLAQLFNSCTQLTRDSHMVFTQWWPMITYQRTYIKGASETTEPTATLWWQCFHAVETWLSGIASITMFVVRLNHVWRSIPSENISSDSQRSVPQSWLFFRELSYSLYEVLRVTMSYHPDLLNFNDVLPFY